MSSDAWARHAEGSTVPPRVFAEESRPWEDQPDGWFAGTAVGRAILAIVGSIIAVFALLADMIPEFGEGSRRFDIIYQDGDGQEFRLFRCDENERHGKLARLRSELDTAPLAAFEHRYGIERGFSADGEDEPGVRRPLPRRPSDIGLPLLSLVTGLTCAALLNVALELAVPGVLLLAVVFTAMLLALYWATGWWSPGRSETRMPTE